MMFWIRELAGWLLIGLSMLVYWKVYLFCRDHMVFEGAVMLILGVFVFRGGIHLLKVAVAANAARQALQASKATPPGRFGKPGA